MNIFLINPNSYLSASEFTCMDPRRARKQLVECCQILASVEHKLIGTTHMRKADGSLYKNAHPHHPLVVRCATYTSQFLLCANTAYGLAKCLPKHASTKSYNEWLMWANVWYIGACLNNTDTRLAVFRKGQEPLLVANVEEYAAVMREYLQQKILNDK